MKNNCEKELYFAKAKEMMTSMDSFNSSLDQNSINDQLAHYEQEGEKARQKKDNEQLRMIQLGQEVLRLREEIAVVKTYVVNKEKEHEQTLKEMRSNIAKEKKKDKTKRKAILKKSKAKIKRKDNQLNFQIEKMQKLVGQTEQMVIRLARFILNDNGIDSLRDVKAVLKKASKYNEIIVPSLSDKRRM